MAYQHKENSGSIFKNDDRKTDNHPVYKGSALIGGVDYWVDSWINDKKDGSGEKYMSLKFKVKEARPGDVPDTPAMGGSSPSVDVPAQGGADAEQDELPF